MKLKPLPDVHALFERYYQARQELQAALITARDALDVALAELQDEPAPTPQAPVKPRPPQVPRKPPPRQSPREPQPAALQASPGPGQRHRQGSLAMRLLGLLLLEPQPIGSAALVQKARPGSARETGHLTSALHRLALHRMVRTTRHPNLPSAHLYAITLRGRAWLKRSRATPPGQRLTMPTIAVSKQPLYQPHGMEGAVLRWMQQHQPELPVTAATLTAMLQTQFPKVDAAALRGRVDTALYMLYRRGTTARCGHETSKHSKGGQCLLHTLREAKPVKVAKVAA